MKHLPKDISLLPFNLWLKQKATRKYLLASSFFGSLYVIQNVAGQFSFAKDIVLKTKDYIPNFLSVYLTAHPDKSVDILQLINFILQILFILWVIIFSAVNYYEFDENKTAHSEEEVLSQIQVIDQEDIPEKTETNQLHILHKKAANKVIFQFSLFWFFKWIAWLFLYGFLLTNTISKVNEHDRVFDTKTLDLVNNLCTLLLIFLFTTITVPTAKYGPIHWMRFLLIVGFIWLLEWLIPHSDIGFSIFSGILASIFLAAFVGNLYSRFIGFPLWVILLLHIYAAIQPLYIFVDLDDANLFSSNAHFNIGILKIVITILAFLLKIIFFLAVTWIMETGRLTYYVAKEATVYYQNKEWFETFISNVELNSKKLL